MHDQPQIHAVEFDARGNPYGAGPYKGNTWGPETQRFARVPTYMAAPPVDVLAVVGLIFGILWLGWVGSIIAVACGHIALRRTSMQETSGHGMAIAALVLGYIGLAFALAFVGLIMLGLAAGTSGTA